MFKAPVAGYVIFSNPSALQRVEFRLIGGDECSCHLRYPLSFNGTHPTSLR